ncbi:MAG: SUMF1/EgtB/PvdO family nonheme iron enzyme [Rhodoferax sp.]|nr:SUMF1/EgtB/PvdO family nonheme iron enzyme [Rhodoferax sp.]
MSAHSTAVRVESASGAFFCLSNPGARINDEKDIRSEGVALRDLLGDLDDAKVQKTVVILDACRDNPYQTRTRSAKKGLARVETAGNATVVAFATAEGKTADDGNGRNGVYTTAFLGQLRQPPQDIRDLLDETANAVARQNKDQKPKIYGDTGAFKGVYLTGGTQLASLKPEPTGRPAQIDPEDEAWQATKSANTAAAYDAYLSEYPKGRFASAARIAKLALQAQPVVQPVVQPPPVRPVAPVTPTAEQTIKDCDVCPEMVVIPGGSFQMGSNDGDSDEKPVHTVNVRSFAMGKYEVTQGQWKTVMGSNPSRFTDCGDDCPVEKVNWDDVQEYIKKLNARSGKQYRLPSEAEWEYAARAGTTTTYFWGNDIGKNNANCDGCGSRWDNKTTAPVGSFKANGFGLYDMSGNVWEWVQDCGNNSYSGAPSDGSAWMSGNCGQRVLRGGSWHNSPGYARAAIRFGNGTTFRNNDHGFRLASDAG